MRTSKRMTLELAGILCAAGWTALQASALAAQTSSPAQKTSPPAAQTSPAPTTTPPAAAPTEGAATQMTMKEAKQKLGLIVFPAKDQTPEQQEADELACLQWGANEVGITPNQPPPDAKAAGEKAKAQVDSVASGAAVKGAAKGAAAGAIIGAIAGDTGTGAAIGGAAGALGGRRAKKKAEAQAEAGAEAKVKEEQQAKLDALAKAMTLCLEAKGYTVKSAATE